jgi:hypothetical protein
MVRDVDTLRYMYNLEIEDEIFDDSASSACRAGEFGFLMRSKRQKCAKSEQKADIKQTESG